ncbi:MAG: hypothetical protein ACQEQ0_08940 [Bacteroidota bacterium]
MEFLVPFSEFRFVLLVPVMLSLQRISSMERETGSKNQRSPNGSGAGIFHLTKYVNNPSSITYIFVGFHGMPQKESKFFIVFSF